jgi:hypothetical protein
MRRFARASASLVAVGLLFAGCHKEEESAAETTVSASAVRCVNGIHKAIESTTMEGLMSTYYEECAELFSQPGCRDAWRAAAKAPLADQSKLTADACRKAYCPVLGSFAFDICKEGFVSTPESIAKDWPPLFDAIVARESGAASAEVSTLLVAVYARSLQLKASAAAAPSGEAPGAMGSASAGAPAGSAAPPSSSAAPPSSASAAGSAAPPTVAAKKAPEKAAAAAPAGSAKAATKAH